MASKAHTGTCIPKTQVVTKPAGCAKTIGQAFSALTIYCKSAAAIELGRRTITTLDQLTHENFQATVGGATHIN